MINDIECSICKPGEERWDLFKSRVGLRFDDLYLYEYRSYDGALFSIVDINLENARRERDEWLRGRSV